MSRHRGRCEKERAEWPPELLEDTYCLNGFEDSCVWFRFVYLWSDESEVDDDSCVWSDESDAGDSCDESDAEDSCVWSADDLETFLSRFEDEIDIDDFKAFLAGVTN